MATIKPQDMHPIFWVSIFRGLRNGIYYGGKVRSMHSLVMNILFKKGTIKSKAKNIAQLTWEHARNLGSYVFTYKLLIYIQYLLQGKKHQNFHQLIAGYLAGFAFFGKRTSVNYQIVLYLFSRNLVGSVSTLAEKFKIGQKWDTHPVLAALCWAFVMFLYDDDKSTLQPSLTASMDFLYQDSNQYKNWGDFVPFYVPKSVIKFGEKLFGKQDEEKQIEEEKKK